MLSLDSPRWARLEHAYGTAEDIPALLAQLASLPPDEGDAEPWFSLWSALAHQGDVYAASLAAVPHVVAALATAPQLAAPSYFQFPAWVEVCRRRQALTLPEDLADAYGAALARLPALAAAASGRAWDEGFTRCALAAIAAAKGQTELAAALLELDPDVLQEFPDWLEQR
ncbi:hypothetical protein [Massilia sp. BJB1822]|uniref:hypothetical protein n=1 Tax=Massilia sp. BJB1822 TaxID=2744470 RepID=UPI001593B452|nr:hypothetical protein [Massilia sp. BJB1822]NVD98841.1 hypothetical protein [Massilia sp. BJB1822]